MLQCWVLFTKTYSFPQNVIESAGTGIEGGEFIIDAGTNKQRGRKPAKTLVRFRLGYNAVTLLSAGLHLVIGSVLFSVLSAHRN